MADSQSLRPRRAIVSRRVTMMTGAALLGAACATDSQAGPPVPQAAAGDPIHGLTGDELDRFFIGRQQYTRDLTELEGLGPTFNQTACGDCHLNPVGGTGTQKVLRAGRSDKLGFDPLEEFGGSLFQLEAISDDCREDPPPSANIFTDRVTNGMMGYGLVEAIPDADLLALEDPGDGDGDGISGRAHTVQAFEAPGVDRVGRFGWKAQVPTLLTFTADASLNEMGLTNRFMQTENDPNGIHPPNLGDPDFCDMVPDPEDNVSLGNGVDRDFLDVVTDFQRFLTQPPQTPRSGMSGEVIFNDIGCAACHVAEFTTADDPDLEPALRNQVIRPYSDFLLHDMGPTVNGSPTNGGGDGIPQGDATANELKTPPLWGLSLRPAMWHDGRFESGDFETKVTAAILGHNEGFNLSEGAAAATAFNDLSADDQASLLAFLKSLGRREFDQNFDNAVTIFDFHGFGAADALEACYGPGPYTPDDPCAVHDIDQDGDVDAVDMEAFLSVYSGILADCNGNGVADLIDIVEGTSLDENGDGVPDSCEPTCFGDTDGDGSVGATDFLDLLADWGPCPAVPGPCGSDLNTDGVVDTLDFLQLLSLWGPCP